MANSIKISDSTGLELFTADPQVNSGFGRYLKGTPAQLLAAADVTSRFRQPLTTVNPGSAGVGLSFQNPVSLDSGGAKVTISTGVKASVGVYNRTGLPLFEDNFIGDPLKVPDAGTAYISVGFEGNFGVSATPQLGDISFGIEAGGIGEFRFYRPFDLLAPGPVLTLAEATQEVFENFAIPASFADLEAMGRLPVGTVASVSGAGHLHASASVDLLAAFNPLATASSIPKLGKLTLSGGAKVSVGFEVKVSGEFQVRVRTTAPGKLRLSFHKRHAGELDFDLQGRAGAGVSVGDKDLLAMLFRGETKLEGTSEEELVSAGVSKAQLDAIREALRKGMSRKLNLELAARFFALREDEAAFEYDLDLNAVGTNDRAKDAVEAALGGDLRKLNALEGDMPAGGLTLSKSLIKELRQRTVSFRINLLGIVNVISQVDLALKCTVFHDEDSGEVTIADEASAKRIGATTVNRKLRKALYESIMITAAYKASGADVNTDFKAAQSFFQFERRCNRQQMSDFLDAVSAVGLMSSAEIPGKLGSPDDFGPSALSLETEYGQAACLRLFLDGETPRSEAFYEEAGKRAVLALVKASDPDAYRCIPMRDPALWRAMRDAGAFSNVAAVLPQSITRANDRPVRVEAVFRDMILISWWASSMAVAAERLAEVRKALAEHSAATPLDEDPGFLKAREKLARALSDAVSKNKSNFDEPWGLVAMFLASEQAAEASATLISPKLTVVLP